MKFLTACRTLDATGWLVVAGMFLAPVVLAALLFAFLLLAAHVGPLLAVGIFAGAVCFVGKGVEIMRDHYRAHRLYPPR